MRPFVAVMVVALVFVGACAQAGEARLGGDAGLGEIDAPACVPRSEICNDLDDDCDGKIDETFDMKGESCGAGIGACAATGMYTCDASGGLACSAVSGVAAGELCDGIDNDCDGRVDEDYAIGTACDGPDADTCKDGMIVCDGLVSTRCTDDDSTHPEICDGIDNDCDGAVDEGFSLGMACDGPDADACNEGVIACDGAGGTMCTDNTGDNVEKCNGVDDDCMNGVDDGFPVGQPCSVGLGACARSGALVCNGAQTGVVCSAVPGAPSPETCGNGIDEDCTGADAICPPNDLPSGAIDISGGGTFTVDLSAAHDDNWAPTTPQLDCGNQGGRDVFYQFTLPAAEVVYFDTFGSNYDSVVRIFAGACTALGATLACGDDACGGTRSQGALQLAAGTYCLVVDQFSSTTTAGMTTLTFRRGGRTGLPLPAASGTVTGTTTGKTNQSIAGCEPNTSQPDVGYFFLTCPTTTVKVSANTCTGTAFDTILYLRTGNATTADVACSDDVTGCGNNLQSRITNAPLALGANLQWLIIDGFGLTGNGPYSISYAIQ
ncbi:MAG: hypothetical protein KF773_25890 [Deltaproteobacteria bacterium]|nr:hypothetical protein [Deltaproteobacteria bacterium]